MILTDKAKVEKDLGNQQEEFAIRIESLKKQESSLIDRLNKLKTKLEEAGKPKEETKEEKKKSS
jgi:chaperonin cofactor prefoldin